jgi:hypothetical protein
VCNRCGGIVPIEATAQRLRNAGPALLATLLRRAQANSAAVFLWALASVPLLILPPLCALVLLWRRDWQAEMRIGDARQSTDLILIVALVNVLVSLAFWIVAGQKVGGYAVILWDWIMQFYTQPIDGRKPPIFRAQYLID